MDYNYNYLQDELKKLDRTCYLNGPCNEMIFDVRILNIGLNYIEKLLTETVKCGLHLKYDAEDYYYQMIAHCYMAGLIVCDKFTKEEISAVSSKKVSELINQTDTFVTAERVCRINAKEAITVDYSLAFEMFLSDLHEHWNKTIDNENEYVVSTLLAAFLCGVGAKQENCKEETKETPYWRDENGKIRCLGDNCIIKYCKEDCPVFCNSIGLELLQKEEYNKAISYFQKASSIAPDFRDVWANMGGCYGSLGRSKEAYDSFKTAFEIDDNYSNAIYGLAVSSKDLKNYEESLEWCCLYEQKFGKGVCDGIKSECNRVLEERRTALNNARNKNDTSSLFSDECKTEHSEKPKLSLEEQYGEAALLVFDEKTREEGYAKMEELEKQGFAEAGIALGQYYAPRDIKKAYEHFRIASDAGIAEGTWGMTGCMEHNHIPQMDNPNDIDWVKKVLDAAKHGCKDAMNEAGNIYNRLGMWGMSMYWYEMAALVEHEDAQYGVERIIQKWTSLGYPPCNCWTGDGKRNHIGKLFLNIFAREDKDSFQELYQLALDESGPAALCIANGYDGDPDTMDKAIEFYKLGIDHGNTMCKRCYADILFMNGEQDTAFALYKEAAEEGEPICMFILGQKYENEGNINMAACWYFKSYTRGYEPSLERLKGLTESKEAKGGTDSYQSRRELRAIAAKVLNEYGFTSGGPYLAELEEGGIFEGMAYALMNNPELLRFRSMSPDLFVSMLGLYMLGVGVYVASCQEKYGKNVSQFTIDEAKEIQKGLDEKDYYELGLQILNIPVTSNEKGKIDFVVLKIKDKAMKIYDSLETDEEAQIEFMRIMYKAGATIYCNRK